jgi:predicted secreted hydrolase
MKISSPDSLTIHLSKDCSVRATTTLASLLAVLVFLQPLSAQYQTALPGYRYEFPRDNFDHPAFQTEWWYYTGNVKSTTGHRFGFELTFFRQAVSRDPANNSPWDVRDLYLAHLALSDLDDGHFYHLERTSRSGPGIAGISSSSQRIWNGNWKVQWQDGAQTLQAIGELFSIRLTLRSAKPPVIHGENGVSQKASGPGRASHYISLTRLETSGTIECGGKLSQVSGLAWMDHEFFTHQLDPDQIGWDWLSLQFDDNTELMLFHIRHKDGSIDPFSAGTFIDALGRTTHLRSGDFILQPLADSWTSPVSRAIYPIRWKISVPKLGMALIASTPLASQELSGGNKQSSLPTYWEGAITLSGTRSIAPVSGFGYLEMTGYDRPVKF